MVVDNDYNSDPDYYELFPDERRGNREVLNAQVEESISETLPIMNVDDLELPNESPSQLQLENTLFQGPCGAGMEPFDPLNLLNDEATSAPSLKTNDCKTISEPLLINRESIHLHKPKQVDVTSPKADLNTKETNKTVKGRPGCAVIDLESPKPFPSMNAITADNCDLVDSDDSHSLASRVKTRRVTHLKRLQLQKLKRKLPTRSGGCNASAKRTRVSRHRQTKEKRPRIHIKVPKQPTGLVRS